MSLYSSQTDVQPITSTPGSTVITGSMHGQTSPIDTASSPGNAKHDAIPPHFITISSEDIQRIADAVKATLGDEIKALVENEVTKAVQPLVAKINHLEEENRSLFFKLDDLEQYGRRPMVRVSGIPETPNENTTEKIVTTLAKADIPLQSEDIIISHRVGKWSNARDKPRQIIAKLRSVDLKFHLVKNAKNLRRHVETSSVAINEDLTKFLDKLRFI